MKTAAELKQIIKDYCVSRGWGDSDNVLEEMLTSADTVFEKQSGSHRWWNDIFKVVDIDGTLIGFTDAQTTGDSSASEMGWSIDWSGLCEVEKKEVMTTVYEKVLPSEKRGE